MPIYEFYCPDCHMIFNFLSRKVDTASRPRCPKCEARKLTREVSMFACVAGDSGEGEDDLPIDESKMEQAMESLASDAEKMNEEDPRQAAELMRKFSSITGMKLGAGMEEALSRLEAGDDPETIEEDLGDAIENEEPFLAPGGGGGEEPESSRRRGAPRRDTKLYDM